MIRISVSKCCLFFSSIVLSRSLLTIAENEANTLQLVQVIFRHGERTPHQNFPTNKIQEFPGGFDELTNRGKQQAYGLGKYLRQRYAKFLNPGYKKQEIYVRSSDSDRSIMTALSVLASLYPPEKSQIWDPSLPWQPIPIHTVPVTDDKLLRKDGCSRIKDVQKEVEKSEEIQQFLEKNKEFIQYVVNNSGIAGKSLSNLSNLYDTLLYHHLYEELPDWINATIFKQFQTLADFLFSSRYMVGNIPVMLSGRLLRQIADNIQMKQEKNKALQASKMFLYSTHDNTIGALQKLLGVFNNKMVPYNFALMIELHTIENQHHVQVVSRDSITGKVQSISLPKLGNYFTVSDFLNTIIKRIPDSKSLDAICQTTNTPKDEND